MCGTCGGFVGDCGDIHLRYWSDSRVLRGVTKEYRVNSLFLIFNVFNTVFTLPQTVVSLIG